VTREGVAPSRTGTPGRAVLALGAFLATLTTMLSKARRPGADLRERGAVVVEYALLVSLVTVLVLSAMLSLGPRAGTRLEGTANAFEARLSSE
jgi:Flp pilus assembly pilin Flp